MIRIKLIASKLYKSFVESKYSVKNLIVFLETSSQVSYGPIFRITKNMP